MRRAILTLTILLLLAAGGFGWWYTHRAQPEAGLVLYGNIDLRQVELAFNNNERIDEVLVQEGDRVKRLKMLARLTTSRLQPRVDQAAAQVASQRHIVERLHNGSRPQEIAQARANVLSAKADLANSRRQFTRLKNLAEASTGEAVSQQDIDAARAKLEMSEAGLLYSQEALDLAIVGPRKEDIAQAEAQLHIEEAGLEYLRSQLADAELRAPVDAVVRTRIMEPGEMASPQRAVFMLAVVNPKWVRAYASETILARIQPSMPATIKVDTFPNRRFQGWVGYVSSVAEFSPKNVETEELRTNLVYEVRIWVDDPDDELRLGTPATVYLHPEQTPSPGRGAADGGPPNPHAASAPEATADADGEKSNVETVAGQQPGGESSDGANSDGASSDPVEFDDGKSTP